MRITKLVALVAAFFASAAPALSQTVAQSECDRAWLASDWATVVVACKNAADSRASDSSRFADDAVASGKFGAPQQMQNQGIEISADALGYAGAYAAREAVGYYKLKRFDIYKSVRSGTIAALSTAIGELQSYGSPTEVSKFQAILDLVQSDNFVQIAPTANILAAL